METPAKPNVMVNIFDQDQNTNYIPDNSILQSLAYVEEERILKFLVPCFKISGSPVFKTFPEITLNLQFFLTVHFFNNQKKYKPVPSNSL